MDTSGHSGLHALDEILLGERQPLSLQIAGRLVVAGWEAEQLLWNRHRRRCCVAVVAA